MNVYGRLGRPKCFEGNRPSKNEAQKRMVEMEMWGVLYRKGF